MAPDVPHRVPLWIDGKEVHSKYTFDVISPQTSKQIWQASSASIDDARQAIEAAQRAFRTWKHAKPAEVRDILLKAADIFDSRLEEVSRYMSQETGADESHIKFNTDSAPEMLRDAAGRVSSIYGIIPQAAAPGTGAFVFKEPFGVNFGIVPWNAPYILGVRAFVYAIATGNTVVIKGSELSPRCFWVLGSVLQQAGLPHGVLNIIYHRPQDAAEVTDSIIEHPLVRKVNFTGSTAVGSIIAAKAGKELKPVVMELGGKASAIVCEDADVNKSALQVALGAFMHSGQICMSTERILVHKKILHPFGEALKSAIEKVFSSKDRAPTLVATAAVEKNQKLMRDAVGQGAKVLYGDLDLKDDSLYRMRPIVISDVRKDMEIYYTESFGPTVSLIAVESDEEAIEIANDTDYGLSGSVFTKDLGRGLRIAKEVDSGAVHINSMSVHDEAMLPHGGIKQSGWGRFNAQWGMEEFTKTKTVTYLE